VRASAVRRNGVNKYNKPWVLVRLELIDHTSHRLFKLVLACGLFQLPFGILT